MTKDEIFDSYLKDECPICKSKDIHDYGETLSGGKSMAIFFRCMTCSSEYTIGFERSRMPIESEITLNTRSKSWKEHTKYSLKVLQLILK